MRGNVLKSLLVFVIICSGLNSAWAADTKNLSAAINGEHRSAENKVRDQFRHPAETLAFFGVEADMTVIESWPGGGWYTQVLAPFLTEKGTLIGAQPRNSDRWNAMLDDNAAVYGKVVKVDLAAGEAMATAGSADMVLDFRNAHNWLGGERADPLMQSWYAALKTGGIVGIVDHRQNADANPEGRTGYIKEQDLIDAMAKHGFEFVAKSDINANSKDTKDHPRGVWTLPPVMAMGDEDKEKYVAIGESDRLTMKFRKK